VVGNDDGGGKGKVQSSGSRSFQTRGAVTGTVRLTNIRWELTGAQERVRHEDDRVMRVGWMVKSSRRKVCWEYCGEL